MLFTNIVFGTSRVSWAECRETRARLNIRGKKMGDASYVGGVLERCC